MKQGFQILDLMQPKILIPESRETNKVSHTIAWLREIPAKREFQAMAQGGGTPEAPRSLPD